MTPPPTAPYALLRDAATGRWLLFERPVATFETADPLEVLPCLRAVEDAVRARGLYAAGALSYEAAPAFDPALATRPPHPGRPLLWFGLFPAPRTADLPPAAPAAPADWTPSLPPEDYRAAFERIKHHIREGDTYQANLTYRLRAPTPPGTPLHDALSNPLPLFARLAACQRATYGALLATPRWSLLSASPELFFRLDGTRLTSRPMKGTAPRGLTLADDRARAAALHASEKNRAENVMIVDLVRNDLGRVATPGSVTAPSLFTLEKYPAVWQLTSTVTAETRASVAEIFTALFPAASITGAPKYGAMRVLAAAEADPRGFYTGAVGFLAPGRTAQFNVAIRTLFLDAATGRAEFGTGGGIVWDSHCALELAESRDKARALTASAEPFSLLETLLWRPGAPIPRLERHLARLAASAEYFDVPFDPAAARARLPGPAALPPRPHRLRLLVAPDGALTVEAAPFDPPPPDAAPLRLALAPLPVDPADPALYHKTTRRQRYTEALAACPGADDALLSNTDGELTESTRANLVAQLDGRLVTPPLRCGLLPGTLRQELLDAGTVTERALTPADLRRATALWLVNSLRGWQPAALLDLPPDAPYQR